MALLKKKKRQHKTGQEKGQSVVLVPAVQGGPGEGVARRVGPGLNGLDGGFQREGGSLPDLRRQRVPLGAGAWTMWPIYLGSESSEIWRPFGFFLVTLFSETSQHLRPKVVLG